MTKQHYISFIVGVSPDRIELVKLYPEGEAGARLKIRGVRSICFCCNRDGLFSLDVPGRHGGRTGGTDTAHKPQNGK